MLNQVKVATVTFRNDDYNLTNRNSLFSSLIVSSILYQRILDRNHKLWNIGSTERSILYNTGAVGMLLHGMFTMGIMK